MSSCVLFRLRSCHKFFSTLPNYNKGFILNACYSKPAYESSVSLRSLYPTSSLTLSTPSKVPENHDGKFSGYVPLDKVKITYSRSSGPGGQAVNMINTKVDLRFHVETADWLSQTTRAKLREQEKLKITKEGFLVIKSEKTRSQQLNLADALLKLRNLIHSMEVDKPVPSAETEELIRKRKEKANQMRLIEKRTKSFTKNNRKAPDVDF